LKVTIYADELLVDDEQHGCAEPDLLAGPKKRTWPENESLLDYIMPPGRSPLCNGNLVSSSFSLPTSLPFTNFSDSLHYSSLATL